MSDSLFLKEIECHEYRPDFLRFEHKGRFPSKLYMGFEMELDPQEGYWDDFFDTVRELINENDFLYAKEDGSVDGCEINTHPFNWNWFLRQNPLEAYVRRLQEVGRASRNCGFHVHLTRSFFTKNHLAKMVKLFYNNPTFITKVSQRSGRRGMSYCHPTFNVVIYGGENNDKIRCKSGKLTRKECRELVDLDWTETIDRYMSLNLCNGDTIEIRIFQGTVNKKLIQAYLEFCIACALYTKKAKFDDVSVRGRKQYKTPDMPE